MLDHSIYFFVIFFMVNGLYIVLASSNLIKKLIGFSLFQTSALLFFITLAYVRGSGTPFLKCMNFNECPSNFSNPLPHVLMLTAIVVGVAMISLGLSIVIRIKEEYDTVDEVEIESINDQIE